MAQHILSSPFDYDLSSVNIGDSVLLKGYIYTGRDAAHKRLYELASENKPLPVELKNQAIYYVGPCPAKPGHIIGPCGPTTSGRVDKYTPLLLDMGLKVMIGKGFRSKEVVDAMIKNSSIYLAAVGGAGSLIAKCVKESSVVAFEDLGTEAIYRLYVENLPTIVAIDTKGNNLYVEGIKKYKR
ncbi:fumarate hydratase class I, anaerobic [Oxobacter pfennigii]|uniref:Fumarate hydratase class I, anaerobic n=1 Tax=Oxobacter pfennigii TaxID=36849 RepID=A0A0P8WKI9_9CLOT|nr:Fe-S-containing hydro-lyase [Oxobacter pfennigii]KPU42851.1 fumarate hydratase class I, anaerobic [Oxobacter pfennigii]